MFASVYSTVAAHVSQKDSGFLDLNHHNGQQGRIRLSDGEIVEIALEGATTAEAAKALLSWVAFSADFTPQAPVKGAQGCGVSTQAFLDHARKNEQRLRVIEKSVPGFQSVFRFKVESLSDSLTLHRKVLNVAMALDGKKDLLHLIERLALTDMEVLVSVECLLLQGMAVEIELAFNNRQPFLDGLEDEMGDIAGPVGSILLSEAFEKLGVEPGFLKLNQVGRLIDLISQDLSDEDGTTLRSWVTQFQS